MPISPQIRKRAASPRVGSGGRRIASQISTSRLATANRAEASSSGPRSRMPTRIIGNADAPGQHGDGDGEDRGGVGADGGGGRRQGGHGRPYRRVEAIDIAQNLGHRRDGRPPTLADALTFPRGALGRFQRPLTGWPHDRGAHFSASDPRRALVRRPSLSPSAAGARRLLAAAAGSRFAVPARRDRLRSRLGRSAARCCTCRQRSSRRAARAALRPAADSQGGAAAAVRRHGLDASVGVGADVRSRARSADDSLAPGSPEEAAIDKAIAAALAARSAASRQAPAFAKVEQLRRRRVRSDAARQPPRRGRLSAAQRVGSASPPQLSATFSALSGSSWPKQRW